MGSCYHKIATPARHRGPHRNGCGPSPGFAGRVGIGAPGAVPTGEHPPQGVGGTVTRNSSTGLAGSFTGNTPVVLLLVPSTCQSQPLPVI